MESVIFEFICANQGAVDADELKYNLFPGDSTNEAICNQRKFALLSFNGQQKVVAKTNLRLCKVKDCVGTCRSLHMCKNFLFSGSCQRRVCSFSHELQSDHNQKLLKEHELENLGQVELCTLLLQNDFSLLPSICHDYNNGDGEFGRCQSGLDCERLHICEKYLNRDCSCWKNHDFNALHTLKQLHGKGVPVTLIPSLRSVFANKEALRYFSNGRGRGRRGNHSGAANNADASGDFGLNLQQRQWYRGRGRGRGGNRGSRGTGGNLGSHSQQQQDVSLTDLLSNIDGLDLYTSDGLSQDDRRGLHSSSSDVSVCASDVASNDGDQGKRRRHRSRQRSQEVRGRGGNRGNSRQLNQNKSVGDLAAAVRDKTEICMFFIKGYCKHEERCIKAHDKMPYRWEVQEGDRWTNLPNNETIEKDYCDPKNAYSGNPPVHFDTMTCGENKVRRLSTLNSLVKPDFILTTEWFWYWQDEFGKWNLYASNSGAHKPADMDSTKLEQRFLDNDKDVVEFVAGAQSYSLSFQDMIQTNKRYGTKRLVSRRPRFVSGAEVREKKVRKPQINSTPLPDNWDKTQIPQTGFSKVSVKRTSNEFKAIEALFCTTMRGFDFVGLERIQNKALWEVFQWQKNLMKSNNGGVDVMEKQLFHGTNSKYVDAICLNNFDWRICGVNGTAFGKGSYFARDANYSHSYTDDSNVKTMFISRVLVGSYTKGNSEYRRPPSKDGGDINFYDSCVNDVTNPSIFVIFEKHQIYPEYLLQYKTTHPLVDIVGGASAPATTQNVAPKPILKPAPKPSPSGYSTSTISKSPYQHSSSLYKTSVTSPYQSSTSPYQTSTSSYQSSTSPYQTSTSPYQTSTSPYQSSTSSYQSSTSSYQSSTSPYQSSTSPYQTSTSPYQTSTSSYQTSISSYQPSTASTQYATSSATQSYTPPAGKPQKKQSDSCVIS